MHNYRQPTVSDALPVMEMVAVTQRLTDLLNEEVVLLEAMQISKAGELQAEKVSLTQVLEAQKRLMDHHPELIENVPDHEREALRESIEEFYIALQKNVRLVAVAKAVNQRVVQAVMDTLAEQQSTGAYTRAGVTATPPRHGISLSLNQRV
jgi:flagellar biosynthesis/type III secretory pathway chaperone